MTAITGLRDIMAAQPKNLKLRTHVDINLHIHYVCSWLLLHICLAELYLTSALLFKMGRFIGNTFIAFPQIFSTDL